MLSALIIIPILGVLLIGLLPKQFSTQQVRSIALVITSIILVWTVKLAFDFDLTNPNFQLQEYLNWIPQLGLSYSLGIDGLSFPLIGLSGLLTLIAIASSHGNIHRPRFYYSMILLVNAGIAGAFLSENLLLFVLFYELELIPVYLLISIWGSEKRAYAGMKFLIYTALSGILILAGFLGMAWLSEAGSFDYSAIQTQNFGLNTQLILLTVLLLGFGIKIPLVPLHTWLPDAYVESSPPVTILLGGILAKLGAYGLIRFGLQLFPEAWHIVSPGLATIGVISVLYGALTAIAQQDIKRMVAYSSIGHMGYILVAAAAANELSLIGAIAQMIAHGLILAILFQLVGVVEEKVGTRDLNILNGLMNPVRGLPLTSALLIMAGMASAGIPGLVGFVAEFPVFQGTFSVFPIQSLLCIIASGLTAVYFVILLNRTCFGKLDNSLAYYPKVTLSEQAPALILAALIFILGIQPTWLFQWMEPTAKSMVIALNNPVPTQIAIKQ
ncbi:NADH dehydrogenase subunit M [Planktothrix serta PCC 8927]|uniref:NADH dehydrogenase subunit M n=1 Tax=Planktothrix serta PCC 8927 TaxID=671068 RepID=A0A7Z9BSC3_9CYAN|nr:NADH-quinone oxidoreductase subunit M [Planktothrix serta]VXD16250.1 NADH dehydrogenase subunit M [Planktothrix serta PCC 8927]